MTDSNGIDVITLRWDSKCQLCGMRIPKGDKAAWYPEAKWKHARARTITSTTRDAVLGVDITVRHSETRPSRMVGYVTHYDTPCANEYTVKAVYDATSKSVKVKAYSGDDALTAVHKQLSKSREKRGVPSAYVLYQGNVIVTTATASEIQRNVNRAVMGVQQCQSTPSVSVSGDAWKSTVTGSVWQY